MARASAENRWLKALSVNGSALAAGRDTACPCGVGTMLSANEGSACAVQPAQGGLTALTDLSSGGYDDPSRWIPISPLHGLGRLVVLPHISHELA